MGSMALGIFLLAAFLCITANAFGASKNPFLDQKFYVNPVNSREFDKSIATAAGVTKINLQKMQKVPSAYWIDTKAKLRGEGTECVEGILRDASSNSPPELVVLMWYDLPNRDCDALASNGEICCAKNLDGSCDYLKPGDCAAGIEEYKTEYVDPFIDVLKEYQSKLPIVIVLEPDSLPNLATNMAHPKCGNIATQTAYKSGAKYALEQLTSQVPSVAVYLDAAHGGWLGWDNNLKKFMTMLKSLDMPMKQIRGFATNVANYQALGIQCPWCPDQGFRNGYCLNNKHASDPCCADPCNLLSQYNFGNNELNFAAGLVAAADAVLGMEAHVITDTGRNGVSDQRSDCKNWCNPRGSGTGIPSTTQTANRSLVDAYFWLKTPGESDGCSRTLPDGSACPRFDAKCESVDSLGAKAGEEPAVEAGQWYDYQVKQLAANARFEHDGATAVSGHSDGSCPAAAGQVATSVYTPAVTAPSMGSIAPVVVASPSNFGQAPPGPPSIGQAQPLPANIGQTQLVPLYFPAGNTISARPAATSAVAPLASTQTAMGEYPVPAPSPWSPPPISSPVPALPQISAPVPSLPQTVAQATTPTKCSPVYGQCGGASWAGATCCETGCTCETKSATYNQCAPPTGMYQCAPPTAPDMTIMMKKNAQRRAPLREAAPPPSATAVVHQTVLLACLGAVFAAVCAFLRVFRATHPSPYGAISVGTVELTPSLVEADVA